MAILVKNKINDDFPHVLVSSTQFKSIKEVVTVDSPEAITEEEESDEALDLIERIKEAVKKAENRENELTEAYLLIQNYRGGK